MSPAQRYRMAVLWIWLLSFLRSIDLGLGIGAGGALFEDLPFTALGLAELSFHVAVLAGLRGRRAWGWRLAAIWLPAWVTFLSVRLYLNYDLVLALLWTPLFALTVSAHRALLSEEVREAFGVRSAFWRAAARWLPHAVMPGALVLALAYAFGLGIALCLWATTAVATATAPLVYGMGSGPATQVHGGLEHNCQRDQ